jgi:hypothetical protein
VSKASARSPLLLAFGRSLSAAAGPTALAAVLAGTFGCDTFAVGESTGATAAAAPWLELPTLVALATTAIVALRLWPLFAIQRPGRDWLLRWQRGPLCGLGAVTLGAALAAWVCSAAATVAMALWFGAPPQAHATLRPHFADQPLLRAAGDTTAGTLPGPALLREVRLRPRAGPPQGGYAAARVEVLADGERLAIAEFGQDRQLAVLPPPSRPVTTLTMRLLAGTVPLWFDAEAVEAVAADGRATFFNAFAYAAVAAALLAWALALGALAGAFASLPTVGLLVGAALFVVSIGGVGPMATAAETLLRGRWLADDARIRAVGPFLAVGGVAMILRMLSMRRSAR